MKESFQKLKSKVVLTGFAIFCVAIAFAQNNPAPEAASNAANSSDAFWYMLFVVMAVLLFAIYMLGNVLINIARLLVKKGAKEKSITLILFLLFASTVFSQSAATPAKADTGYNLPGWNIIMAGSVILIEAFAVVVLLIRIRIMLNDLSDKGLVVKEPLIIHLPKIFDSINASVAVEKEKDILLDHNYDGIQELDNSLPPWWIYGFYCTIVFAVVYLFYFNIAGGPSSREEYVKEMDEAKIAKDEYMRKNALNVDENTVTLADAAGIAEGKTIFTDNCAACHGQLGEGIVGPNLTDDYWLHGGSIKDVFKTIKTGYPAKGMKSWATDLTPVQMKQVASYIKSLHGTTPPNAKSKEGELYNEAGSVPMPADSTVKPKTDSSTIAGK